MHFRNGSEGALRVPRSSMVTYCLLMSASPLLSVGHQPAAPATPRTPRTTCRARAPRRRAESEWRTAATEPTGASIGGHRVGGTVIGFVRHSGGIKEGLEAMRS
jgi:hypothetical protein